MDSYKNQDERMLSGCEAMVMKVIWDSEKDISLQDIMEQIQVRYGREYKRSTVATFLKRLTEKGFIETYRKGYFSYAHALKEEEEYKGKLLREEMDLWFDGSTPDLVLTLTRTQKLSPKDLEKIRGILDELDD